MDLITLAEAKHQLQMDHDEDDTLIVAQITAASGAVLNYMKGWPIGNPLRDEQGRIIRDSSGEPEYERDSAGTLIIREEIKAAVKMMVGYLYRLRDDNGNAIIGQGFTVGYYPPSVLSLLYPLRDPALA